MASATALRQLAAGLLLLAPAARAQVVLHALHSPAAQFGSSFGFAIAAVPDADGDGEPDVVVGAYGEDAGPVLDGGRAHLFSGATAALLHTVAYPGTISGSYYGEEVAGLPDVDGDGRGDFAVGGTGEVYVYSGATGQTLYVIGPQPSAVIGFGDSLAGVSDLNGDGRGDLLLGCFRADHGAAQTGRAFVFSGVDGALLFPLNPPVVYANGHFGRSVATVPDVDGDGLPDLLIGADNERVAALTPGQAHLYSGATGAHLRTVTTPNPEGTGDFGRTVAGVADVDGDGRGDLLVGAPYEDGGAGNAGRAYLFSGATGALLRTITSPNAVAGGNLGFAVAGTADLDGDETPDLLVGAPGEDGGEDEAGRAYTFSGATGALLATLESPTPRTSTQGFGYDVAALSDVNADGRSDLVVGAPNELAGPGGPIAGRVYVISGGLTTGSSAPPPVAGATLAVAPNPVRGAAMFSFTLAEPGPVRLILHDALGRAVATVADSPLASGAHTRGFDTSRLPPGLYLARLSTGGGVRTAPLTVVR